MIWLDGQKNTEPEKPVTNRAFTKTGLRTVFYLLMNEQGIRIPYRTIAKQTGVAKVNGFNEVYLAGTKTVELSTGHTFKVATLSAIVPLKFIAYDDRPEVRAKDARDIINIITTCMPICLVAKKWNWRRSQQSLSAAR